MWGKAFTVIENSLRYVRDTILRRIQRSALPPNNYEGLAYYREQDSEANTATEPPEDEFIDLCCAWGVEFYTPAYIENLINSFRKLGWRADDHPDPSRDPEAWLYGLRRYQYRGAWMNLGYLLPKDTDLIFAGPKHRVPLPAGVKYARAGIYSVSPSLVSIVVSFVFVDDTSSMFDKALRTDRSSYTNPIRGGWQIHDPRTQKMDDIGQIRTNISRQLGNWFADNLPGLFSSGLLDREIPTCEFVTLRRAEPFPSQVESEDTLPEYLSILGLNRDYDVWKSSRMTGLKFRITDPVGRQPAYHSVLAIKENRHIDTIPERFGSTDRASRIVHIDDLMPNLLCLWSILPMLEGYTQHLSKIRDSAIFKPRARRDPVGTLESLGGHVSFSVDVAAVTSELAMHSDEQFPLLHDVAVFEPCDSKVYEIRRTLEKQLEFTIKKYVTWLQRTDESVREHLTQYGSLLGVTENVRVQKKITRLTWALLALAVVTVIATMLSFWLQYAIR